MKKRFFALLLAVMMIVAAIPTAAFATEEPVIPYSAICPNCHEGYLRVRRTMTSCVDDHRAVCPHDPEGRYNCMMQRAQYSCEKKCDACGFVGGTYFEYGYVWKHDACPCH